MSRPRFARWRVDSPPDFQYLMAGMRECYVLRTIVRAVVVAAVLLAAVGAASAQGYVAVIGGGAEASGKNTWSDEPYRWIVEHARGRPVAILSADDETEWLPSYFVQLGATSSYNLKLDSRARANNFAVYNRLASAGAVFIKGGDQWEYLSLWRGTRAQRAIREVFDYGGVVAGTSAGAALLGEIVYDARNGTVFPEEALRDPYNARVTFTTDFVGLVPNTLFDTHFTRDGRIARLLAMVARLDAEGADADVLGVGVDEKTALLIPPSLRARVTGEGAVTIVRRTPASRLRIAPGLPPVFTDVAYDQVTDGFVFNLAARAVASAPPDAATGFPPPGPAIYTAATVDGASASDATTGEAQVLNATGDPYNLQLGRLAESAGTGAYGHAVVMTRLYRDVDFIENRVGGLQWALARHPYWTGVAIDGGGVASLSATGALAPVGTTTEPAILVYDCRGLRYRAFSRWVSYSDSSGPRQSVALTNVRVHLLVSGWSYDSQTGAVAGP